MLKRPSHALKGQNGAWLFKVTLYGMQLPVCHFHFCLSSKWESSPQRKKMQGTNPFLYEQTPFCKGLIYQGSKKVIKMVLSKLSVLGHLTALDYSRTRAYCPCSRCGWWFFGHFSVICLFLSSFSLCRRWPDMD